MLPAVRVFDEECTLRFRFKNNIFNTTFQHNQQDGKQNEERKMRSVRTFLKAVAGMAAIFLMWSVLGIQRGMAQSSTPCLPDCFNDQWSGLSSLICALDSCGTTFQIFWRARIACNQWYDYYLERVEVIVGSLDACLQYYGSMKDLLQALTVCLLEANPAGFPPKRIGDCNANWRVMKGPCWYQSGNTLKPCAYEKCCLDRYEVCRGSNGERIVTKMETIDPGVCEVAPPEWNAPWCQPVCD